MALTAIRLMPFLFNDLFEPVGIRFVAEQFDNCGSHIGKTKAVAFLDSDNGQIICQIQIERDIIRIIQTITS